MNKIYLMVIITNRNMRNTFYSFFERNEITVTFSILGAGTASSALLDYLGLEDSDKMLLFTFVTRDTWKKLKRQFQMDIRIDLPGRGIAFLIPASSVGGKKALEYFTAHQNFEIEEESTLKETKYELLVIIANTGYTDTVMDAARSANAPGGTVVHAKGTGAQEARKFLGISLAEEKEMIFIVVSSEQKNDIMKAVMEQAGLHSKAGALAFSLPVTSTAGLRLLEEEIETDN